MSSFGIDLNTSDLNNKLAFLADPKKLQWCLLFMLPGIFLPFMRCIAFCPLFFLFSLPYHRCRYGFWSRDNQHLPWQSCKSEYYGGHLRPDLFWAARSREASQALCWEQTWKDRVPANWSTRESANSRGVIKHKRKRSIWLSGNFNWSG